MRIVQQYTDIGIYEIEAEIMKRVYMKKRLLYALPLLAILSALILSALIAHGAQVTESFSISVTTGTNSPTVYNVTLAQVTPTAASHATNVVVRFNVTDADGVDDDNSGINISEVRVNITFLPGETAEYSRFNNTGNCATIATFNGDQDRTYECKVAIRYHDNASALWRINASVRDKASSSGTGTASYNSSQNLTINSLSAIDLVNDNLALTAAIGSSNNELTLVINNTGNFAFTYFNLTPRLLNASTTDFFELGGENSGPARGTANFSFNTSASTGSGFGVGLSNNTWINISDNYEFTSNEGLSISLPAAPG
ncbi:hypothetical protein HYX10_04040, partial [Candidatus Woesearchaeota archaeon]|nr:hypothetical protein [Candidatus Woesearchaeota archaeon]